MTHEITVASKNTDALELPLQPPQDVVMIANTPAEMEVAQRGLIDWVVAKVAMCEAELAEAQANVAHAKAGKWRVGPFQKIATAAAHKVYYYVKMKLALEAGYTIMPDLPGIIMAVKTTADRPRQVTTTVTWSNRELVDAQPDESPAGEGHYVDPSINYTRWETKDKRVGSDNVDITRYAKAHSFDFDLDFPVKLVKPQILEQTQQAMLSRIFDEIVVMPGGKVKDNKQRLRGTDPIVLGRIVRTEGSHRIACSFLITWWISTADL